MTFIFRPALYVRFEGDLYRQRGELVQQFNGRRQGILASALSCRGKDYACSHCAECAGRSALHLTLMSSPYPPLLGFASMAHLLATPGETREIDFAMSGYGKLSIKATADSDAVRASVKVWAGSNGGTLTVHFARTLGTARVRLSLTDGNGAVVTEIVQCDTLAPKEVEAPAVACFPCWTLT